MIFWKRMFQKLSNKWYPRSITVGKPVETQELAERLARESTLSPADVHAVIRSFPTVMGEFMAESRAVHLEGFGWFRYLTKASGKGVDSKEKVSSDQITGIRIQFTPERQRNMSGGYTRSLVNSRISFAEWMGKDSDITEIPDGGDDGGGDDVLD